MADFAPQADILIITVTEVESVAVMEAFQEATSSKPIPTLVGERVYHNLGEVRGRRVFMALSEMGAVGPGASVIAVQKAIDDLHPSDVIMVGIAFGLKEGKQKLGDVLVSQQLCLYEPQRIGAKSTIRRGDQVHASAKLLQRFRGAVFYGNQPTVHFGLILSGEKLVDNIEYRNQLRQLAPEAIGGEMEGAGLYTACIENNVHWIVVKAICDWADGNKAEDKETRQWEAAHNAANFVVYALQYAQATPPTENEQPTSPPKSRPVQNAG